MIRNSSTLEEGFHRGLVVEQDMRRELVSRVDSLQIQVSSSSLTHHQEETRGEDAFTLCIHTYRDSDRIYAALHEQNYHNIM